jgi:hypothetical protein
MKIQCIFCKRETQSRPHVLQFKRGQQKYIHHFGHLSLWIFTALTKSCVTTPDLITTASGWVLYFVVITVLSCNPGHPSGSTLSPPPSLTLSVGIVRANSDRRGFRSWRRSASPVVFRVICNIQLMILFRNLKSSQSQSQSQNYFTTAIKSELRR